MAWMEEESRMAVGDERQHQRGFIVHEATSEYQAREFVRQTLAAKTPSEEYWPPLDITAPTRPINQHMFLVNVSVTEVALLDPTRATNNGTFKCTAQYGLRATCPIIDYNGASQLINVTQAQDRARGGGAAGSGSR